MAIVAGGLRWQLASSRVIQVNKADAATSAIVFYDSLKSHTMSFGWPYQCVRKPTQGIEYLETNIFAGHFGGWWFYIKNCKTMKRNFKDDLNNTIGHGYGFEHSLL